MILAGGSFLAALFGDIISHAGSEGLSGDPGIDSMGDSELDMGVKGMIVEPSQVEPERGENEGVSGSVSMKVSKDLAESGGGDHRGEADMGVNGGELGVILTGGGTDENR